MVLNSRLVLLLVMVFSLLNTVMVVLTLNVDAGDLNFGHVLRAPHEPRRGQVQPLSEWVVHSVDGAEAGSGGGVGHHSLGHHHVVPVEPQVCLLPRC